MLQSFFELLFRSFLKYPSFSALGIIVLPSAIFNILYFQSVPLAVWSVLIGYLFQALLSKFTFLFRCAEQLQDQLEGKTQDLSIPDIIAYAAFNDNMIEIVDDDGPLWLNVSDLINEASTQSKEWQSSTEAVALFDKIISKAKAKESKSEEDE